MGDISVANSHPMTLNVGMDKGLIVHTEASTGRGGQEVRVFTEMEYMRSQGYRCVLAAPRHADIFGKCQAAGFECWEIGFGKWGQLGDIAKLVALFNKHKPMMVGTHSNVDSRVGLMAASICKVPVRIRYRHLSIPVKNTLINRWIYKHLCDAVITTGDCISEPLIKTLGIDRSRVRTISTGIRPPVPLMEREAARKKIQESLRLSSETRFIGMMAELRYWKGHLDIIKAFDSIAEKFPQYHVVFVGGGDLNVYKTWSDPYPSGHRIHFVGFQKDFYDYFRGWDVAMLASTQNEGIPQTLIHAMFSHTPVVGTRVGGIPEIVEDGVTGLLVPGGNPQALALAIDQILNDPSEAQRRAQTAFERANKNHTIEVMGEKTLALMDEILKRKN